MEDAQVMSQVATVCYQCWRVESCCAGHLNIDGCKMSKRLKKFISIRSGVPHQVNGHVLKASL